MLFHRRETRAPIPGVDLELVAIGIEEIQRGTFAAVVLPDRRPRGTDPRGGVLELRAGDAEGDVGVFRQRRRPGPLVKRKAQPQIAGKEVGAFAPARQRLCSQCLDVEAERTVEVPHRKGDVIEPTDHGADIALRMANARMKVATAPSTAALTPR